MIALALVGIACLPQQPPAAGAGSLDLQRELARLVDLPTAAARRAAADELAGRRVATLAQWLAACASFGAFSPHEAGPSRHAVTLSVLDQDEKLELFLYVPAGHDGTKPRPLLLWGHGAGGTGADQYRLWQEVADRVGMYVLAPTSIDREPGYHFAPRERAATLAALRWARRQVDVDENAIFLGGWSQGGHLAWDLALRHPDLWAGVLPIVGGPRLEPGPKCNLRYLENLAHLPLRDLQGSQDDARLLANLRLAFARLAKLGARDSKLIEFADRAHDADLGAVDWPAFFALRRTPVPKRVVRLAADKTETRAAWLELVKWSQRADPELLPEVAAGYDTMSDAGQRAHVLDRYGACTARVVVDDKGQGRFVADGKLVSAFALLLTPEQLGKGGAVEIKLEQKPVKKTAVPEVAVLLREFAERFDRTFLPVARVVVP